MFLLSGVGAMTWSPLACGIISGKYDGRVPPYSRASLKVDEACSLFSVLSHSDHLCWCHPSVFPYWLPVVCFFYCVFVSFRFCNSVHTSYICVFSAMLTSCTVYLFPTSAVRHRLPAGVSLMHFSACT